MRRSKLHWGLLLAGLVLAGCGESLCQRAQDTYDQFNQNAALCGYPDSEIVFNRNACDADVDACSGDDRQIVKAYFDCLDSAVCDPSQPDVWANQANACGAPVVSSDTCAAAVNPE